MDSDAAGTIRSQWREHCRALGDGIDVEALLGDVVRYLEAGLAPESVARLLRLRAGRGLERDAYEQQMERWHLERSLSDLEALVNAGRIGARTADEMEASLRVRIGLLADASVAAPRARVQPARSRATAPAPALAVPAPPAAAEPAPPPFSLRDLVAEHSVVILGALGAFLLVVATVLFLLYGSAGGGWTRVGAVVALDLVFGVAGYLAIGRERLAAVGQIYIALAAMLLPLVAASAWTFLELRGKGISVDQALGVSGAACALVYGLLALRLGLLAYAEIAGLALMVGLWGVAGALAGDAWRPPLLAAGPLLFGLVPVLARTREFRHFEWFGHASALVAVVAALAEDRYPAGPAWMLPALFGVLAASYLAWHAITPRRLHSHTGFALATFFALFLLGPLGSDYPQILLPFGLALVFVLLLRRGERLGTAGRLYRPAAWHLPLALAIGVTGAVGVRDQGAWPVAIALWLSFGLYALDFVLQPNRTAGHVVRALLPAALLATAEAASIHAWSGALVALAVPVCALPLVLRPAGSPLVSRAGLYLYLVLPLVAVELREASFQRGEWSGVVALAVAGTGFVLAAESGRVWMAGLAARALFGGAWFWGVEAAGITDWRGPADAVLALLFVALAQVRALAGRPSATQGRRWLTHLAAAGALALTLAGPEQWLWWRLTATLALVAIAYWWQAATRTERELPWIAWSALAGAAFALVEAAVPQAWRGAGAAGAAVVLTAAWWPARRPLRGRGLDRAGFFVLMALAAAGVVRCWLHEMPTWQQAAAAAELGILLLAWWRMGVEVPEIQRRLRAAAAFAGTAAVLLAASVLRFDAAAAGLVIVVLAAGHALWASSGAGRLESWYALAMMLAAVPALMPWPGTSGLELVVALEFAALAALIGAVAARLGLRPLAGVVVLALVPAVNALEIATGLSGQGRADLVAQGSLAFAAGVVGLGLRARLSPGWGRSTGAGAALLGLLVVTATYRNGESDVAASALLAYGVLVFVAGVQERRWLFPPVAVTAVVAGLFTLLRWHGADTLLYPAGLGLAGLACWTAIRALSPPGRPRDLFTESGRWLGIAALLAAGAAGFAFPDRTGPWSLGALLAAAAFLVDAGVLVLDGRHFARPQHLYAAVVVAAAAGFFLTRELGLGDWELVVPGLGLVACGALLRQETRFAEPQLWRQGLAALGALLVMGWAIGRVLDGEGFWLVALLVEGALAVAGGIVLRSRVLLAVGAGAVALVSLRSLLSIAEAGYLFVAFGIVALVLLASAGALAFAGKRLGGEARELREQLAGWD